MEGKIPDVVKQVSHCSYLMPQIFVDSNFYVLCVLYMQFTPKGASNTERNQGQVHNVTANTGVICNYRGTQLLNGNKLLYFKIIFIIRLLEGFEG